MDDFVEDLTETRIRLPAVLPLSAAFETTLASRPVDIEEEGYDPVNYLYLSPKSSDSNETQHTPSLHRFKSQLGLAGADVTPRASGSSTAVGLSHRNTIPTCTALAKSPSQPLPFDRLGAFPRRSQSSQANILTIISN